MPIMSMSPEETLLSRVVRFALELAQGRSNAHGEVTLRANQTTTTVTAQTCGLDSHPKWSPMTANAAVADQTMYCSAVNRGSFVLTHASNAQTDKTFRWSIQG